MTETEIKQQVREFYDRVGWQMVGEGVYQNARYEDLRPVSREYIHRCHLRVNRHLKPTGRFLLDAGCGPVQYPEYLTYSKGYHRRVCLDISIVALQEARKRVGEHGLYVVADVANLPFKPGVFDGIVSLHTLHHLPIDEQEKAYRDLYRVLAPASSAVLVNGWTDSPFMRALTPLVTLFESAGRAITRLRGRRDSEPPPTTVGAVREPPRPMPSTGPTASTPAPEPPRPMPSTGPTASTPAPEPPRPMPSTGPTTSTPAPEPPRPMPNPDATTMGPAASAVTPVGTYIQKLDATWLRSLLADRMQLDIRVWRSVNVRFLRAVIHAPLGGRYALRLLYWLEERFPRYFGENGQYPLIIIHKP